MSESTAQAAKTTPPVTTQAQATASIDPLTEKAPPAKANEPAAGPPTPVAQPTPPELIRRPAPTYRDRDGPGTIVLKVLVNEAGRVSRVIIAESFLPTFRA